MKLNTMAVSPAIVGVAVAISLGVGFGGGVLFQKTQLVGNMRERVSDRMEMRQGGGANQKNGMMQQGKLGQGAGMRGNVLAGEVSAVDDKSITIKMQNGSSQVVALSADTKYTESATISADKLTVGASVAVFGETNDGTTTATSIELNPMLRGQQN